MATEQRRDSIFLTLAPETAKSFNGSTTTGDDAKSRASSFASSKTDESVAVQGDSLAQALQKTTRSDSISSNGSARKRFLKLNPVRHDLDAKESDFVDVED